MVQRAKENESEMPSKSLNLSLTHRGEDLQYPNLIMLNFKSDVNNMFGVIDTLNATE
jgi:hypothetical protein